jgi:hypothetical protein
MAVDVAGWREWSRVRSEGVEDDAVAVLCLEAADALVGDVLETEGVAAAPPAVLNLAVWIVTSDLWKRRDTLFANQSGGLDAMPTFSLPLDVRRQVASIVGPWARGPFA